MRDYDFYHGTDARRQGIGTLVGVHVFMLAFGGILYAFHAWLGLGDRWFFFGMGSIMLLVYLFFLWFTLTLIIKGGQWVFAIRDGVLHVRSPARSVGATFTVSIADIDSITQIARHADGSSAFYIICKNGEKHEITQNSGLNIDKLFAKLHELNPDIRKEYNTPSDVLEAFANRSLWFRILRKGYAIVSDTMGTTRNRDGGTRP